MNGFILAFALIMVNGSVVPQIIDQPAPTKEQCEAAGETIVAEAAKHPDQIKGVKYTCVTVEEYLQFKQAVSKGHKPESKKDDGSL